MLPQESVAQELSLGLEPRAAQEEARQQWASHLGSEMNGMTQTLRLRRGCSWSLIRAGACHHAREVTYYLSLSTAHPKSRCR